MTSIFNKLYKFSQQKYQIILGLFLKINKLIKRFFISSKQTNKIYCNDFVVKINIIYLKSKSPFTEFMRNITEYVMKL